MTAYDVDALIEAFVQEEARTTLVEGLRDSYEHTNPFDPSREADLIVENWLPPILYAAVAERDEQIAALQAQLEAVRSWVEYETYDGPDLSAILESASSDVLDRVKREAAAQALASAAAIARKVRESEIELHQVPFDEMPKPNQYFAYGAVRAAENIEAVAATTRAGGPSPTPDDTRIASLEHAVIESALALHHVAGAPADTVYQASRTHYRNTIALAEALKESPDDDRR